MTCLAVLRRALCQPERVVREFLAAHPNLSWWLERNITDRLEALREEAWGMLHGFYNDPLLMVSKDLVPEISRELLKINYIKSEGRFSRLLMENDILEATVLAAKKGLIWESQGDILHALFVCGWCRDGVSCHERALTINRIWGRVLDKNGYPTRRFGCMQWRMSLMAVLVKLERGNNWIDEFPLSRWREECLMTHISEQKASAAAACAA